MGKLLPKYKSLTTTEARLLYSIWDLQFRQQRYDTTADVLAEALGRKRQSIQQTVCTIRGATRDPNMYVLRSAVSRIDARIGPGRRHTAYRLSETTLVTRSSTATLIQAFRAYMTTTEVEIVSRADFRTWVLETGRISEDLFDDKLEDLVRNNYLRIETAVGLAPCERVFLEEEYLARIANVANNSEPLTAADRARE